MARILSLLFLSDSSIDGEGTECQLVFFLGLQCLRRRNPVRLWGIWHTVDIG